MACFNCSFSCRRRVFAFDLLRFKVFFPRAGDEALLRGSSSLDSVCLNKPSILMGSLAPIDDATSKALPSAFLFWLVFKLWKPGPLSLLSESSWSFRSPRNLLLLRLTVCD